MPRSCSSGLLEDAVGAGVPMTRRGCSPGARWPSTLVGAPRNFVGSTCAVCRGGGFSYRDRIGLGLQQTPSDQPSRGSQHRAS